MCCCCLVTMLCQILLWPPWTMVSEAPLSMGFPRQEYWSGLPFPSPGDRPNPGTEPVSPAWQVDSQPLSHLGTIMSTMEKYIERLEVNRSFLLLWVDRLWVSFSQLLKCGQIGFPFIFSVLSHLPLVGRGPSSLRHQRYALWGESDGNREDGLSRSVVPSENFI